MKLQGFDSLSCPASSSISWDTVAAIKDQSITFRLLDDVSRWILADGANGEISHQQLLWVATHYEQAFQLRDHSSSRRFGLAFNIAYTWNHTTDGRAALANVWSALEAMFGDKMDSGVTRSLAARIAAWVPGVSAAEVRDLYSSRCDAVHGRWVDAADLYNPLRKSIRLLRASLIACIERAEVPLPDWIA